MHHKPHFSKEIGELSVRAQQARHSSSSYLHIFQSSETEPWFAYDEILDMDRNEIRAELASRLQNTVPCGALLMSVISNLSLVLNDGAEIN